MTVTVKHFYAIKGFAIAALLFTALDIFANEQTPIAPEALLDKAHVLRSSEPQEARLMLDDVARSKLTSDQQDKYDFLNAYLLFMNRNIEASIEAFKTLSENANTKEQRFNAHASLVSLYAGTQNWSAGFDTLLYVSENINQVGNTQSEEQAHMAAINFYSQLDENEVMIDYIQPLIDKGYGQRFLCLANMHLIAAQIEVSLGELSDQTFKDAISACELANEKIVTLGVYNQWAIYYFKIARIDEAIALITNYLADITNTGYEPLLDDAHMLLSQTYFETGDVDNAQYFAKKIIGVPSQTQGKLVSRANIVAFEILYKVSEAQQDFTAALEYHKLYADAKSLNITRENAKMLSIQKAKQDSEQKSNQIALLDAENSLLKANALLDEEAAFSRQVIFASMLTALLFLCIWIYKKRSNYIKLRDVSRKDAMTGIANRHHFTNTANDMSQMCQQNDTPLSLVLFDLDDFKSINDTYGHQTGDEAIIKAVKAARSGCRNNDFMGRLGGEEFGILLDGCGLEKAYEIAQACRKEIEKTNASPQQSYYLSASFGVVSSQEHGYAYDDLFEVCDKALYQSKQSGKNKVSQYQA